MTQLDGDFADNWCSLLELFVSASGLKLRLPILDTVLIRGGRVIAHFYTNREGVVCRYGPHEVTRATVYHKVVSQAILDPVANPGSYVAVAHFPTGISRLLKRNELQDTLSNIFGTYEFGEPANPDATDAPFCIQNYVIPKRDTRYVASFSDTQGVSCSVFARRFSSRYSHPMDSDASDAAGTGDPNANSYDAFPPPSTSGGGGSAAMSAEELLVESQLVAMGLLEARPLRGDAAVGGVDDATQESYIQAPKRIRNELARTLSTVSSFTERAHGSRLMGLVVEFVAAAPSAALATAAAMPISSGSNAEVLVMMAVHAVQIDSKGSRGRLGTFTERWQDYLAGMGPPPAPQVPSRRSNAPGLLRGADNSVVKTDRNGVVLRSLSASPNHNNAPSSASLAGNQGNGMGLVSNASNRLTSSYNGAYGIPTSQSMAGGLGGTGVSSGGMPRPVSSGRVPNSMFPGGGERGVPVSVGGRANERPTSAQVLKVGRDLPNVSHGSSNNGHYTLRNALSAARPGSGGNPTSNPASPDAYLLWTQRQAPQENVAASLAMELEATRERLQKQTDLALRAEAALSQLASTTHQQINELREENEELRAELDKVTAEKRKCEEEIDRFRQERVSIVQDHTALTAEVERLKATLAADRETLTQAMRSNAGREDSLDAALRQAKEERDSIHSELSSTTRRLEEEREVVEAVKSQLVEYKNAVAVLQTQVRRGKNNKPLVLPPNVASLVNANAPGGVPIASAEPSAAAGRASQMAPQRSTMNVSSSNIQLPGEVGEEGFDADMAGRSPMFGAAGRSALLPQGRASMSGRQTASGTRRAFDD